MMKTMKNAKSVMMIIISVLILIDVLKIVLMIFKKEGMINNVKKRLKLIKQLKDWVGSHIA